jgi:hypothetical protein
MEEADHLRDTDVRMWEDSIKMGLRESGRECVDWR